jgi:outer membrane protein assembly factor BamA
LQENEVLLGDQDFIGNEKIHSEDLAKLIPLSQRPNNKPLNITFIQFTPRVWIYNFGLNLFDSLKQNFKHSLFQNKLKLYPEEFTADSRIERNKLKLKKKVKRTEENIAAKNTWLWRNFGEPQAITSPKIAKGTSEILEKYLKDIGYMDALVTFKIEKPLTSDKSKLSYVVNEGPEYVIDTIFYKVLDPELDSLLFVHQSKQLIQSGDLFDIQKVEAEKIRIEHLAKQNGYYNFLNQYIIHEAINANYSKEEFFEKKRGNLRFTIVNPPNQPSHKSYVIKEVVFKGIDPYANVTTNIADTVIINRVKYITVNSGIPERILDKKVISRPGELYNIDKISETQRQIGLLNQFLFANSQINPINDQEVTLEYYAPQSLKYSFNSGPGLNHVYNGG